MNINDDPDISHPLECCEDCLCPAVHAEANREIKALRTLHAEVSGRNVTLHCENLELKKKIEELVERLEKISITGLDPNLGQIVGSEHYEKAWLDCVEVANETIAKHKQSGVKP